MMIIKFHELSNFTPKQKLFLEFIKTYRYVLYGGVVGSGKSYALRWITLYWLLYFGAKGFKNVQAGLFCRTYPELNDRHLKRVKEEFPSWLGTYYEQKHEFHLKPEYGGGILMFRNLDEPEKYRSAEFAIVAVDELTQIPKSTFDLLLERNRWPGLKNPKFFAVSNPVGPYSLWVREFFIEKNSNDRRCLESGFLKAEVGDNPYLPDDYYDNLEKGLDENLKKALLEGDWYALDVSLDEGGYINLLTPSQLENALTDFDFPNNLSSVLGVDVGAGVDETAIVLRSELGAKVLFNKKLSDTMQILPLIADFLSKYMVLAICIDITGVGKGIFDRLNEIGFSNVYSVTFGEKSDYSDRFFNQKAELFWKLRDWILQGGKLVRNDAWNELLLIRYKIQSDRVIRIQPKEELLKKGLKSPNVADALALSFKVDIKNFVENQNFDIIRQEEWML